jgi:GTPase
MDALFHCESSFTVPERRLFVVSGHVTSGVVRKGMQIQIPFNDLVSMAMEINSIEQISSADPNAKVGITFRVKSDDELSTLMGLNIGGEILKIVESVDH